MTTCHPSAFPLHIAGSVRFSTCSQLPGTVLNAFTTRAQLQPSQAHSHSSHTPCPSNPAPRQMRDTASVWDPTLRHTPSISTNDAAVAWHVMLRTGSLSSPCLCRTSPLQHAGCPSCNACVLSMRRRGSGQDESACVPACSRMQPQPVAVLTGQSTIPSLARPLCRALAS